MRPAFENAIVSRYSCADRKALSSPEVMPADSVGALSDVVVASGSWFALTSPTGAAALWWWCLWWRLWCLGDAAGAGSLGATAVLALATVVGAVLVVVVGVAAAITIISATNEPI